MRDIRFFYGAGPSNQAAGQRALDTIRNIIWRLRLAEYGHAYDTAVAEVENDFLASLEELDLYLTGSTEGHNSYSRGWNSLIYSYEHMFYLSDGGYTRLLLDIVDNRVSLVDWTPRSKEKWEVLTTRRLPGQ